MNKILWLCGVWATLAVAPGGAAPAPSERTVTATGHTVVLHGVSDDPWPWIKAETEQQLALTGDSPTSAPLADDLAFFLTQSYRRLGYADASIDWQLNDSTITLTVAEGALKYVGTVTFTGTTVEDMVVLEEYLLRPTHERLGRKPSRTPFVASELSAGTGLVVRYLQSLGFLNAEFVSMETRPGAEADAIDVHVTVQEGPRSVFGPVTWTGDLAGLDKAILAQGVPGEGEPFSEVRVESLRKNALTVLQEAGHFAAQVSADYRPPPRGGPVPVTLHIVPGLPYTIKKIEVDRSLSRGAQRIARAAFRHERGKLYSPTALEIPHRQVISSGVFSRLEVQPVLEDDDELILRIIGAEEPRKTLSLFGGYETFLGPILGAEWRQVNLFDTGNGFRFRVEANATGFNGSIGLSSPVFLGSRFSWDLLAAAQTSSYFDYDVWALTLRSNWARTLTRHVRTTLSAGYVHGEASSGVLTADELGPASYRYTTVGGSLIFDYRNSPVVPTRGWMASVGLEGYLGSGGAGHFLKSELLLAGYWPLSSKWRLAAAARQTTLHAAGDVMDIPIDLRLYNGGATTVRSYAEREMGPHSPSGTPLGGLSTTTLNLEVSYELVPNLELAGFVDAGALSQENSGFAVPEDWHYAFGLGLRYRLPFGPLRVDYGYNPSPKGRDDRAALHITFGFAF